jgi:hypothetical protein
MYRKASRWVGLLAVAIAGLSCEDHGHYVGSWPPLAGRPECPHDWDFKQGQLAIIGGNIDIPEFHDCQRFITYHGDEPRYDALYAIFASDSLYLPPAGLWAVAEIYAEGQYAKLGIKPGYNCLFLGRQPGGYDARMVPVSSADVNCRQLVLDRMSGTPLMVNPVDVGPGIPSVARWDWDDRMREQYIGIKCDSTVWCEVARQRRAPSARPSAPTLGSARLARTRLIKGWYDEQHLAYRDANHATVPSFVRGTIYPDSLLDDRNSTTDFDNTWVVAAYVALDTLRGYQQATLDQYKDRLNLDPTEPGAALLRTGKLNVLSLCHGALLDCVPAVALDVNALQGCDTEGAWWTRVDPANGGASKYLCATRRGHEGMSDLHEIPGTARWRWMASDEGVWDACGQGCCETLGPGG